MATAPAINSQPPGDPLAFDFQPRTRVVYGVNSVARVGELAREFSRGRVLLVTDAGIVAAGHAARVQQALETAVLTVAVFDRVQENPTTRCVQDCMAVAKAEGIDLLVGLGGGSSLDTAKGCNFLLTNGGKMQDYWGVGKATRPMLPLIAIPTTAGTGSECQSFTLIADEQTHQKMACGDPKAAAKVAILDPALTLSQPPRVTACTGIDALSHALETAVTRKRNALSAMYSQEAFHLGIHALPTVLREPDNLEARGRMLLAAALAGTAIENSMLGAAHSAANPLTAHFGIIHGQAVGLMLPAIIRFNAADPGVRAIYQSLAALAGLDARGDAIDALADRMGDLLELAGLHRSLAACGIRAESVPMLAEEAARQWTAQFNPRAINAADFQPIYQSLL